MRTAASTRLPAPLLRIATMLELDTATVVFHSGEPARHVYFLCAGRVTLSRFGAQGEQVDIHTAVAGEFFAEASLFSERYHCAAVAIEPAVLASIRSSELHSLLRRDAELSMLWLSIVSLQLRQARARVERLCLKSAPERVRHFLLTEGGSSRAVVLNGTVKDLASDLGLTHESLYRTLATMQRDGVITRDGKTIALLP